MKHFFTALRLTALLLILCSGVYTGLVWAVGGVVFPHKSTGSLITEGDKVVGSELVGQLFESPGYFHGRASASGYDAAASYGSNLAVSNPALYIRMEDSVTSGSELDGLTTKTIAFDRVTASASGLDPHITPENAKQQIARIARERNAAQSAVATLVETHTEPPLLWMLGPSRVNVLLLNLDLDKTIPNPKTLDS